MQITVLLILAFIVLFAAIFGVVGGEKYPWRWSVFAFAVAIYMLIQQLPVGK